MHIAYFITGHGYGHALRSATVANEFSSETEVTFITQVHESFFDRELSRPFKLISRQLDCGCLQHDSITVDIDRTLSCYTSIAVDNQRYLGSIAAWCRQHHVTGIVSDIVPCAFEIARLCGIPSVAVSNFTWFDIYREYLGAHPGFRPVLDEILTQYRMAGRLLALTPSLPMSYFSDRESVPVVGRKGHNRKADLHRYAGTRPDKKTAIIYIGDFGLDGAPWNEMEKYSSWEFFGLHPIPGCPVNYHLLDPTRFSYPDTIASADCIIGKLGYGLVAEAMVNATPIIFLPRNDFAEYPYLEKSVQEWGGGIKLSKEHFSTLEWTEALDFAAGMSSPVALPGNGAAICAREIESYFSR